MIAATLRNKKATKRLSMRASASASATYVEIT